MNSEQMYNAKKWKCMIRAFGHRIHRNCRGGNVSVDSSECGSPKKSK